MITTKTNTCDPACLRFLVLVHVYVFPNNYKEQKIKRGNIPK